MAFEVFDSGTARPAGAPAISMQASGVMRLNVESVEILKRERVKRVLILWDGEHKKLAIKPIGSADPRAYRISFNSQGNMASIATKAFARSIGWTAAHSIKMPAEWINNMLQAKVPSEYLNAPNADSPRTHKKKPDS